MAYPNRGLKIVGPANYGSRSGVRKEDIPHAGDERGIADGADAAQAVLSARGVDVFYGEKQAMSNVSVDIPRNRVTAMIGPSGCGKSTFLRCLNRMNDLIDGCRVTGEILLGGEDIHAPELDVVTLRMRGGMVFKKPNPFPESIYDNVAYGSRIHGMAETRDELDEIVFGSLERTGLPEEVRDRMRGSATGPLRRTTAAAVHRPRHRDRSRGDSDGRALLGARSHRKREGGGSDRRAAPELQHRRGDPFHAAGGADLPEDGLLPSAGGSSRGRPTASSRRRRTAARTPT